MNVKQVKTFRGICPSDPEGRKGLRNPERGFRFEVIVGALEGDPEQFNSHVDPWPFERYVSDGVTMTQAYCYLSTFFDSPISSEKLEALEADFTKARAQGVKFLLRFVYKGSAATRVPSIQHILSHMDQLKPMLDQNWDVIYALQIGWLGSCGENFGDATDAEASEIVQGTLALLPPDRMTMVRCPRYKPATLKGLHLDSDLTAVNAFTDAPAAKIGFFNEGTCADYWDCGTFLDPPFYASEGNWEFDLIAREAPYMPVDGELFWTNPKQDEAGAYRFATIYSASSLMQRLRLQHYTTFSLVHNFSELDKARGKKGSIDIWKETPLCAEDLDKIRFPYSPDYFDGDARTAFEFIRDHLGYRLQALRASYDAETSAGALFEAETVLVNYGFSTMINPRVPYYVLYRDDCDVVEMPAAPNGQHFQPCRPDDPESGVLEHLVSCAFRLPGGLKKGVWKLALWLPDAREPIHYRSDYAVRLANAMDWIVDQEGRGMNLIGEILVK